MPGFRSFSVFWHHFVLVKLATNSIRDNSHSNSKELKDVHGQIEHFNIFELIKLTMQMLCYCQKSLKMAKKMYKRSCQHVFFTKRSEIVHLLSLSGLQQKHLSVR